jgi:RNA polymerase sigma factor (sigma-70 family)
MLGTPLLRLRSDQQLVALFREGNEEAFGVIHDRYRPRLLAYVRQMLPGRAADIEDALQDVFMRTYVGLRTSGRPLTLRPWLYRVAHNRCIDELRRPAPVPELLEAHDRVSDCDPAVETEQRDSLRKLVIDIGRLPEQQRSALLMREMSGMAYADVASALDISVPAVKSLLVRARIGLAQALEARDAVCADIRHELAQAQEAGVRPSWMARRHMRDCAGCRACRAELRVQGRRVAALAPTIGPLAVLAKVFGVGTGAGGGTATAASASGATAAGTGGALTAASGLATVTVGHVATILAAAVVTAGGAVAVQQTVATHGSRHASRAIHQAAPAALPAAAKAATLRMPATHIAPVPAPSHVPALPVDHVAPPTSPSTAGPAQWRPATHWHPGTLNVVQDISGAAAGTTSTTCTPPPTACTATQTTTCSGSSGSSTSSDTQSSTGQPTSTGTTTTTGSNTSTSAATTSTATSGSTSDTSSSSASSSCSTTTPSTGSTGTQTTGSGQTSTGTGSGQTSTGTGTGQTSTGTGTGTTQSVKPT